MQSSGQKPGGISFWDPKSAASRIASSDETRRKPHRVASDVLSHTEVRLESARLLGTASHDAASGVTVVTMALEALQAPAKVGHEQNMMQISQTRMAWGIDKLGWVDRCCSFVRCRSNGPIWSISLISLAVLMEVFSTTLPPSYFTP